MPTGDQDCCKHDRFHCSNKRVLVFEREGRLLFSPLFVSGMVLNHSSLSYDKAPFNICVVFTRITRKIPACDDPSIFSVSGTWLQTYRRKFSRESQARIFFFLFCFCIARAAPPVSGCSECARGKSTRGLPKSGACHRLLEVSE